MTTRRELLWVVALIGCVLMSAVGVVYAKHASRKLFVEQEALRKERDRLDIETGRLLLEQSTWAAHSRIERVAR